MLCASILAVHPASAQQVEFERVLLPVYVRVHALGAFGTLWTTPFVVYNDSDAPVAFVPNVLCLQSPRPPATIPPHVAVSPNIYGTPFFSANELDPPVPWLVYIDKQHAHEVTFQLQLISVRPPATVTQIPIIRERDFRTGNIELLNVPPLENRRLTIRTYEPDVVENATVMIRILRCGKLLYSTQRFLQGGGGQYCFSDLPAHPNYDVLALSDQDFADEPCANWLRIEIVPEDDVKRLTAMATITDNATGAVTVITPF